ncbi:LacI family DNA-binding transcriptional regulator [Cryobacterium tepidiphilum]|jgi:DNA-binding LacI/PurR family transcriptional regulator|uniref:LacI family transcriptional regulator n=1 Tax=Cryobacterium tepidiphilum TaxID=2486026 RepID=A0A3M8LP38_9MICO|nr:LacI family DNA-binding transcriptional regulator [Cryobacterium tepidiphilum]RNE67260.1 LacI family transcriptional regulator [Cryobacterium tepidiphilum]
MGKVRLQDVASRAGVSMKTVSNVVHDYPHVSEAMRHRVQRAIDELGYRPNVLGRRLATGRTGLLALAFADVSLPYFSELARIVSAAAARRGYRLLLEQTDGTLEGERAVVSSSEAGLVDGVIFQPSVMSSTEIAQHRNDVPLVLLGEGPAPVTVDHVMIDNAAAAAAATTHLLNLGRRRIGFLGHEEQRTSATSKQRLRGYQHALEEAGLTPDLDLLLPSKAVTSADAVVAVSSALDRGLHFDGLVCRDDLAAIGALRALQERGLGVPDDVAVTGWDNISMTSFTHPTLTTIAPDTLSLAETALDLLEERINGHDGMGRHRIVDFTLLARESAPGLPAVLVS